MNTIVIKKGTNKNKIKALLSLIRSKTGFNSKKYIGIMKLKENPVQHQKKMRDEW